MKSPPETGGPRRREGYGPHRDEWIVFSLVLGMGGILALSLAPPWGLAYFGLLLASVLGALYLRRLPDLAPRTAPLGPSFLLLVGSLLAPETFLAFAGALGAGIAALLLVGLPEVPDPPYPWRSGMAEALMLPTVGGLLGLLVTVSLSGYSLPLNFVLVPLLLVLGLLATFFLWPRKEDVGGPPVAS